MNTINIEKRFEERLDVIRRAAEGLPMGKRNLILNNCAKLSKFARVAGKQLQVGHYRHANYDARTDQDFKNLDNQKKRIWAALLSGRTLSLENAGEMGTSQMHTHFAYIRREIEAKNLPYVLCDEWYNPGDGRSRFKRYWLEDKIMEEDGN